MNTKNRLMTSKRNKARHLVVVKGYSQKEAAEIVGVSEKSICVWAKRYNWRDAETKEVLQKGGLGVYMKLFFEYVRSTAPDLLTPVKKLWGGFLNAQEKGFEDTG